MSQINDSCLFLARGKTYISTRLSRYLNWVGIKTRLFNVGMYRRKNSYTSKMAHSADFFDPKNEDAVRLRESWRKAALNDIIQWVCLIVTLEICLEKIVISKKTEITLLIDITLLILDQNRRRLNSNL